MDNPADESRFKYYGSLGLQGPIEDREQDYWDAMRQRFLPVVSGAWIISPTGALPITRLRMSGVGTVTMSARNREGVVTSNVYTATVSGPPLVDYAYPGDDATEFSIVLTGTATAEVI